VHGLRIKIFNFCSNLILLHYDVFVLTETWLSDDISSAEFFPSSFLVFRCDRNSNTNIKVLGGGVLIAAKKSLSPFIIYTQRNNVEQVFIKLLLPNQRIIAGVYLSPSSNADVYESLAQGITNIYHSYIYDIAI
jgi:hypothetical protein